MGKLEEGFAELGIHLITYVEHKGEKWVPLIQYKQLMEKNRVLEALLKDRSCCCAKCTKHNMALEEKYGEKIGNEL